MLKALSHVKVLVALVFFFTQANAMAADELVKPLILLQSKVEVGVSVREYNQALADVITQEKLTGSADPVSPEDKAVLDELRAATKLYVEAGQLWDLSNGIYGSKFLKPDSSSATDYIARYPDALKDTNHGGATTVVGIYIDALIQYVWKDASQHLETARTLIASRSRSIEPKVESKTLTSKVKKKTQ